MFVMKIYWWRQLFAQCIIVWRNYCERAHVKQRDIVGFYIFQGEIHGLYKMILLLGTLFTCLYHGGCISNKKAKLMYQISTIMMPDDNNHCVSHIYLKSPFVNNKSTKKWFCPNILQLLEACVMWWSQLGDTRLTHHIFDTYNFPINPLFVIGIAVSYLLYEGVLFSVQRFIASCLT